MNRSQPITSLIKLIISVISRFIGIYTYSASDQGFFAFQWYILG